MSSAGFWGNALASPIVGAWGDRVHAKRTILFASLLLQVGSTIVAVSPCLPTQLLTFRGWLRLLEFARSVSPAHC